MNKKKGLESEATQNLRIEKKFELYRYIVIGLTIIGCLIFSVFPAKYVAAAIESLAGKSTVLDVKWIVGISATFAFSSAALLWKNRILARQNRELQQRNQELEKKLLMGSSYDNHI